MRVHLYAKSQPSLVLQSLRACLFPHFYENETKATNNNVKVYVLQKSRKSSWKNFKIFTSDYTTKVLAVWRMQHWHFIRISLYF